MKYRLAWAPLLAALALTGCGSEPQVVVEARLADGVAAEPQPLVQLPVRLLPYDRDAIFDSLAAAAKQPEPQIPQELVQQLGSLDTAAQPVKLPGDSVAIPAAQLRTRLQARIDSLHAARRQWAQQAFAPFDSAVRQRLEAAGREELVDSTGTDGRTSFAAEPGKWWVYARYALQDEELYWNLPLEVKEGAPALTVRLTRMNAQVRPLE